MSAARKSPEQSEGPYLSTNCNCGRKCGTYLRHYELVRCDCGQVYWALQEKRGAPLRLFPWPGHNLNRQEMAEKYGVEEAAA